MGLRIEDETRELPFSFLLFNQYSPLRGQAVFQHSIISPLRGQANAVVTAFL